MIKSFKCKDTERLFNDIEVSIFKAVSRNARRKFEILNSTLSLQSLRVPPGNQLEQLKGKRRGQFSIRINDPWRICFKWRGGDAFDIKIIDYHRG